jgi:predicted PurR-regulated permease PerM
LDIQMSEQETSKSEALIDQNWGSRNHVQTLVLMLVTVLGVYLCYRMAVPFLAVLAWALTLAVLFAPLQRWLESKLKHASLAAIVSILLIGTIVIVPAIFVGEQLIGQALKGAQLIETKVASGEWRRTLEAQPQLVPIITKIEQYVDVPNVVKTLNTKLGNTAGAFVKGSIFQVLGFILVFYMLFFFLRDRHWALKSIAALSPLSQAEMDKLFNRVGDTIHATVYGTFAIAAVQGALGGLMFWWLDLPAPLLWSLVMSFLAIVPMLGASIVWAPAVLFLALEGNWGSALILAFWGMLVVSTIDNLLRPVFVGNRLKLHTILVFMSVIGGLLQFGPAGLILGPVTLAVTITLLEIWLKRTSDATATDLS